MTAAGTSCVLDASVIIELVIDEDLSDLAQSVFQSLTNDPRVTFWIPEFAYIECANALRTATLRKAKALKRAIELFSHIQNLDLTVVNSRRYANDALRIALEEGIAVYDAVYIAIAARMGVPLLTADERLVRTLKQSRFQIRSLRDLH